MRDKKRAEALLNDICVFVQDECGSAPTASRHEIYGASTAARVAAGKGNWDEAEAQLDKIRATKGKLPSNKRKEFGSLCDAAAAEIAPPPVDKKLPKSATTPSRRESMPPQGPTPTKRGLRG